MADKVSLHSRDTDYYITLEKQTFPCWSKIAGGAMVIRFSSDLTETYSWISLFYKLKQQQKIYEMIVVGSRWQHDYGRSTAIRLARRPDLLSILVICHPSQFAFVIFNAWTCAEGKKSIMTLINSFFLYWSWTLMISCYQPLSQTNLRPNSSLVRVRTLLNSESIKAAEWLKKIL